MFGEASRFVALKGKLLLFLFHNSLFSLFFRARQSLAFSCDEAARFDEL
jgi:hypothetical protein